MTLVQETLNQFQVEALALKQWLFFEPRAINHPTDADIYLLKYARYKFINELFQAMQMFDWPYSVEIRD